MPESLQDYYNNHTSLEIKERLFWIFHEDCRQDKQRGQHKNVNEDQ